MMSRDLWTCMVRKFSSDQSLLSYLIIKIVDYSASAQHSVILYVCETDVHEQTGVCPPGLMSFRKTHVDTNMRTKQIPPSVCVFFGSSPRPGKTVYLSQTF